MSTAQNMVAVERADSILVPIATTIVIKQGDAVKITSNLGLATSGITDVGIGIADETNPVASLGGDVNPNIGGAAAAIKVIPYVPYKGAAIVYRLLTTSDTPSFWDAIYTTANPQVVTTASGSSAVQIGRCMELVQVTGAASNVTLIKVLLCGAN